MTISATLSKPTKEVCERLGKNYERVRLFFDADKNAFDVEFFTEKQSFQRVMSVEEAQKFIRDNAGTTFKNCTERTQSEIITTLSNKKGRISVLKKPLSPSERLQEMKGNKNLNRAKNYIISEGTPVPFLVALGVMSADGKVLSAKYDKFRQINRFLEFIADVVPELEKSGDKIRIADFGSGKSYLTFAVYHFLHNIRGLDVDITGLDLKADVIKNCASLAEKLGYSDLHFAVGDIAKYSGGALDMVITLHACDTATDFALSYAVEKGARVILSVPCCQHELNAQISKKDADAVFAPLLKYGIIKERFSALCTDALRAEYLERCGYGVQILEFIDIEHTPKNLLIRAVKKSDTASGKKDDDCALLESALRISPSIKKLLG